MCRDAILDASARRTVMVLRFDNFQAFAAAAAPAALEEAPAV